MPSASLDLKVPSACNTLLSSIIQVRSHPTRAAYCKCDKERTVRKLIEGWGEGGASKYRKFIHARENLLKK